MGHPGRLCDPGRQKRRSFLGSAALGLDRGLVVIVVVIIMMGGWMGVMMFVAGMTVVVLVVGVVVVVDVGVMIVAVPGVVVGVAVTVAIVSVGVGDVVAAAAVDEAVSSPAVTVAPLMPGAYSEEDSVVEVAGAVEVARGALVGRVIVVSPAAGRWSAEVDAEADLGRGGSTGTGRDDEQR